jgi:hypothetical protein
MTSRSTSALRNSVAHKPEGKKSAAKPTAKSKTGKLPEWNLADLYSGIDAPEVRRDLEKMDSECVAFETDYKGKLAENTAEGGGKWLATRRSTISPAASALMRALFMPATASIPRFPNSMATFPSG